MSQDFVHQLSGGFARNQSLSDKLHVDLPLLVLLILTVGFGLMVLYSAAGQQWGPVVSQMMRFVLALVVMYVLAQIHPDVYKRIAPWAFGIGLVLLILVLLFGKEVNGSRRWLALPGLPAFQPSEVLKLVLPMVLAGYFHDRVLPPRLKHLFWALIILAVPVLLIGKQPDLGTAILIASSGLIVLMLAGVSWKLVFTTIILAVASAPALWVFVLKGYQKSRILTMLDPEKDPLGAGWNIIQSKTAIGSGGFFGKGMSQGTQSQLDFLPESKTDFIVAVLAEEWGFLGILMLMMLYGLILLRGLIISLHAQDTFGRLLAGAITFTFFVYVIVNTGMVSGLLPVVGVPLPLVSYGGTSMVTLFAGFGMMMSIHTHKRVMF